VTARRLWSSLFVLMAGIGLLGAAGSVVRTGSAAETRTGGTLRLSRFSDLDYVDPALAWTEGSWQIGFATCAKLFNYPDKAGPDGARLIPEVAKTFTVSRDGRTYTFELRPTFRFHTGAPVTARSFADAFNRDADPRMRSPAQFYLHELIGADAVIQGRAASIAGVRVLSRYRLQIRLTEPVPDLTARLTMPFFCPILPNTPIDPAGIDNPPGSGPYYVAERIVNRRTVLRRNPYYRGGRPAHVDQVVWTPGERQDSCLVATEQNRLDHCVQPGGIPIDSYRRLADAYGINRPGGQFFVAPAVTTWYVAFNHDRPAFEGLGQIPLKKAINYAIDRPELARAFGYLGGRRTDQMLPPALGRDERIYPLKGADPSSARRWLARARVRPKTLVLYASSAPLGVALAQVLVFNLRQIGIDLEVKYFDGAALGGKVSTRGEPFDLVMNGWATDYADPLAFLGLLLDTDFPRGGTSNLSYYESPSVNARIEAANRLTGESRRKAWADLDVELMRDDPPWAPFIHQTRRAFVSPSFGCVLLHPIYGMDIAAACKK
jgi:ABC-type oligopeptide transport system substrate-binding subunit